MRPRAGNTRPYGIPEPLMQSVGVDDSAARTFTEISRHRRADEDIRPYGKYGCPVHFTGASTSAARLFMEDSLLPAVGASPSPAVSSKAPTYPAGAKHSRSPGGCAFYFSSGKACFLLTTNFCKCRPTCPPWPAISPSPWTTWCGGWSRRRPRPPRRSGR